MIRINGISLPLDYSDEKLKQYAAKALRINANSIISASLHKRSIDARDKNNIHFSAALDVRINGNEVKAAARSSKANIAEEYNYVLPVFKKLDEPPVIIGCGPCGLFAGLILAKAGQEPVIIERGRDVDSRTKDVSSFWKTGVLDTASNVQFGEGGAGTFSDGKLNTGTKDKRIRKVLDEFVAHGAPEDILYLSKPHIGTDKLKETVKNIRNEIIAYGGRVLFETTLTDIICENNSVKAVEIRNKNGYSRIETHNIILAIGHSARDTFRMLLDKGIKMEQKAFSVGVRIEQLQEKINKQQYGDFCHNSRLPAADYKLAVHLKNGRGVYTFCMCPGGSVVAAASENGRLVTNGMSEYARDLINANSAVLVNVTPEDFGSQDILAGVALQRAVEEKAFECGGGNYKAPVQRVGDFLSKTPSKSLGEVIPTYKPGYELTDIGLCLPDYVTDSLRQGLIQMNNRLKGFADNDAVLTAVESRSSSPVRILRGKNMQSVSVSGLYPCGEGAGYAGGIMSAAVDGIKAAEEILLKSDT